jgi:hypothetical protein
VAPHVEQGKRALAEEILFREKHFRRRSRSIPNKVAFDSLQGIRQELLTRQTPVHGKDR